MGLNGSGKTNLLDAIHMISLTKSAFNYIDQELILEESDYFKIIARIEKSKEEKIEIRLKTREKKAIFWNDNPYEKLSEHIGKIPLVLITPNDTDLIRQGSEVRRRFFDALISTINPEYLRDLTNYQKVIRQRNILLKRISEQKENDFSLLNIYDEQILPLNVRISKERQRIIRENNGTFEKFYHLLSGKTENIQWHYLSRTLNEDFESIFKSARARDIILQRTSIGIHKDEFDFLIENKQVKKYASQGQQKSTVLSLKLLQYLIYKEHFKYPPILLLDDIFDKLDSGRMTELMSILSEQAFRQIFVTDAHPERSIDIFKKTDADIRIFEIHEGKVINVK